MKTLCCALSVLALVSLASANQWQIDVVDTCGSWSRLQLKTAPDGVVHLFYSDRNRILYHSYRDSLWHREVIGAFPLLYGSAWNMDVGSQCELGLALGFQDASVRLLARHDTAWTMDSIPIAAPYWDARLSWDSAGDPAVAYVKSTYVVGYAVRGDSGWVCETIPTAPWAATLSGLVHTAQDEPCAIVCGAWEDGNSVFQYTRQDTSWVEQIVDGAGWPGSCVPQATARDPSGTAAVCDNWADRYGSGFRYAAMSGKSSIEDGTWVQVAAMVISAAGERHVTYLDQNTQGPLKHTCYTGGAWVKDTILNGNISLLGGIDILDGSPIVAFYEPGAGICVAGMLTPGISDRQFDVGHAASQASFVNPRSLTVNQPGFVLALSGRRVLTLKPGANDARALAPGVYFVREGPGMRGGGLGKTRKVVVTR